MYDVFSKYVENLNTLPKPLIKANQLWVTELEKMSNFQINVLQSYMNMGLNQLKAVTEVNDVKSLQDFLNSQAEVVHELRQKMTEDAQAWADLSTGFKASFDDLAKESVIDFTPKAA